MSPPPGRRPARGKSGARAPRAGDARRDSEQLKKNQERLGVGPEHKSESMRKGRRGTFP